MTGLEDLLLDAALPVVTLVVLAALLIAREVGAFAGRRRGTGQADGDGSDGGLILSAVLGLLALLIGFTFSMALNRFEGRRELVVAEANAIGTAAARFDLLDAPDSTRMSALFGRYAQARLAYGLADHRHKPPLLRASRERRAELEADARRLIVPIRATPLGASLIAAVNDVSDRGTEREAALAARLPGSVLAMLLLYAAVAAGVMGYVLPGPRRHRAVSAVLFLLVALAAATILDLDRPQGGSIRVSQEPMADVARSLAPTP